MSRLTTDERLRRLLAVVPWVAGRDAPTVEEVCERFGYTEPELVEDLDLLFLCGVHPFSPDTMIEADVSDGRVRIRYADYFSRPLRLTPHEALALVAAASALVAVPGADPSGPLARGTAKLAAVLGVDPDEAVDVELGEAPEGVLATLQQASRDQRQVEVDYYSYWRDAWTRRTIDPHRVFSTAGAWYVWAWCHRVEDDRLFRVDRMREPVILEEAFEASSVEVPPVYSASPDDPLFVIDIDPTSLPAYALRSILDYPNEGIEDVGGRTRVKLRISEPATIERLLLRLGPAAEVVEGDREVARAAAARILQRYRQVG